MKIRIIVVLSLSLVMVLGMDVVAQAQTEVTESVTSYWYVTYKAMPLGPGRFYCPYESFGSIFNDTGEGLFHGVTGQVFGGWLADKDSWEDAGYAVYTMKDGEKIFFSFKASGKGQTPGKVTAKVIGGTGKYANMQGESEGTRHTLNLSPQRPNFMSYQKIKIRYKLP